MAATQTQIGIRLTGIKPADVRAGELANIISSFEDMIASTVRSTHPHLLKNALGIGLVKLEDKSIGLEFASKTPELTHPAYFIITKAIDSDNFLQLPSDTLKHLKEIHAFIKSRNCEGELFSVNGVVTIHAVLQPTTIIPNFPEYKVETTIFGRIVRVGGVEPRVVVELTQGESIFCLVTSESLARQLGERLYTWAGLTGIAKLNSDTLAITDFKVTGMTEYEGKANLTDSFANLSAIASAPYASIHDIDQYIADLRN